MKKALFILATIMAILVLFTGTGLQALMFIVVAIAGFFYIKNDGLKPLIIVIAVLMALLNLTAEVSVIDFVFWMIIGIMATLKDK